MPSSLASSKEWQALQTHAKSLQKTHMRDLFTADKKRFDKFHQKIAGAIFDYSRHRTNDETLNLLFSLAKAAHVEQWRDKMFAGENVNTSENRAALHTALRGKSDVIINGEKVSDFVTKALNKLEETTAKIRNDKTITDVVNIGIGGSDLGSRIVCETLQEFLNGPRVHFVSNIDGGRIFGVLKNLKPENTAFIVVSKTFSTMETITNASTAKKWVGSTKNFYAVTVNEDVAKKFGIPADNILPMRAWIGGRMSLWSSAGLAVAVATGFENFKNLLAGAKAMDDHFKSAPLEKNIPVLMGMIGIWYRNFMDFSTHGVLPYAHTLRKFPAFVQQLDMESNGKSVTRDGKPVDCKTGPVIFGETGTNAQHAFMQMLHQGTDIIPVDFIIIKKVHHNLPEHHRKLNANALAQAQALMHGQQNPQSPNQSFDGNRPSSTLVLDQLNPWHLGLLLALYEHKVFVQGIIWNINSFDQWGVELGKTLANALLEPEAATSADQTTQALMQILQE